MPDLIYTQGTVSVSAGGTVVTGVDTLWSNLRAYDSISIDGGPPIVIEAVTDVTHLVIAPWQGGAKTNVTYRAYMVSPLRFEGGQQAADVARLVAALNKDGFFHFVSDDEAAPDPSLGDEGQFALQVSTGKMWVKTTGAWVFYGTYKSYSAPRPWDSVTQFNPFDVVTLNGSAYVAKQTSVNQAPPNATYWTLLVSKGDTGIQGPVGPGYGGSSPTNMSIVGAGNTINFNTQPGMAYGVGSRVRLVAISATQNYMEGRVTAYTSSSMAVLVDRAIGSGTFSSWSLSIAGESGSGDMLRSLNLSDLTNISTALTNLGISSFIKTLLDDADGPTAWSTLGSATNNAANGYFKLPSGVIVQYGSVTQPSGVADSSVTFPTSFPNAARSLVTVPIYNNVGPNEVVLCNASGVTVSAFSIRCRYISGTGGPVPTSAMTVNWIAIGY
ncbi:hypothetical protein X566_20215 [Afipia sp. P52-10]|uniref:gp53-like domain-containing protein n=1 Tax=Afipia sp. P52-10 TaxID=1429916 RepID=UPI0003DF15CE|nr:hypothetical protein [Afipia sp. P52-10]ETR75923.1 hypothetical protein X566_20215 [Afipia sp. P52-10]